MTLLVERQYLYTFIVTYSGHHVDGCQYITDMDEGYNEGWGFNKCYAGTR